MGLRDRLRKVLKGPPEEDRAAADRPSSASVDSYAAKRGRRWDEVDPIEDEEEDDDFGNAPRPRRRSQVRAEPRPSPAPLPVAPTPAPPPVEDDHQTFQLHLYNEDEGLDTTIDCYEGETVLDAAERNGVELPFSCLNGGCFMCAAMLDDGEAEMGDQFMLDDKHAEQGFRLLCCTTVQSDCEILTHQNDRLDF